MLNYTIKKWLARLAFIGLVVSGLVVLYHAIDNPGGRAEGVMTVIVMIAAFGIYDILLKPATPLKPAVGLEASEHFPILVTDAWQFAVPATRETIRAALLSVHDERYGRLELALSNDHFLRATHYEKGWELERVRPEATTVDVALRPGQSTDTKPLKVNWWTILRGKAKGGSFSNTQAEQALLAFLEGSSSDYFVWRETTRG